LEADTYTLAPPPSAVETATLVPHVIDDVIMAGVTSNQPHVAAPARGAGATATARPKSTPTIRGRERKPAAPTRLPWPAAMPRQGVRCTAERGIHTTCVVCMAADVFLKRVSARVLSVAEFQNRCYFFCVRVLTSTQKK
jgi:hypothetical protein